MAFTPITVTRRYLTAELTPATGTVRLTPTVPMVNGDTVVAAPRSGTLDAEGDLTLVVAPNNDPTTAPVGAAYTVREQIDGQPVREYFVVVPYDAPGGAVDLSTLAPATVPPVVTFPIAGPQGLQGVGIQGDEGPQGPAGPAGPAGPITTVNGDPGPAVVLDAADVGAQPVDTDLSAIAALTPSNDDVMQRKAGAWVNRTLAQLRADLDVSAFNPASGQYYYLISPGVQQTLNTLGNGTLRLAPRIVTRALSLDRLGGEISTVGEAGSKLRLGIYADDGTGLPGALVVDAGQIAGDSATVQELTISTTLAPGLYWFGGAVQSAPTTQPTVRCAQSWTPPIPIRASTSGLPGGGGSAIGYTMTGVTGALPSTFTLSGVSASMPRLIARAA